MDLHSSRNPWSKKVKDNQEQTCISWWSKWTQRLEFFKNKQKFCCNVQSKAVGSQQTHWNNVKFLLVSHPFCWCNKLFDWCSNKENSFIWGEVAQRQKSLVIFVTCWTQWKQAYATFFLLLVQEEKKSGWKKTLLSCNNWCRKQIERKTSRPSFLSAFDAERKD